MNKPNDTATQSPDRDPPHAQHARLIAYLREHGRASCPELAAACDVPSVTSRMSELVRNGWPIRRTLAHAVTERGIWRRTTFYELTGAAAQRRSLCSVLARLLHRLAPSLMSPDRDPPHARHTRLIAYLREHGRASCPELAAACDVPSVTSRMSELVRSGWPIRRTVTQAATERGIWRRTTLYELTGAAAQRRTLRSLLAWLLHRLAPSRRGGQ